MAHKKYLLEERGFRVSETAVQTPRRMIALKNIEEVQLKTPLLGVAAVACIGALGFILRFGSYLYWSEIISIMAAATVLVVAGLRVGTLQVKSLALRDEDGRVFGEIGQLKRVKAAIEAARGNSEA